MINKDVIKEFKEKHPKGILPGGTLFEGEGVALCKYGKGLVLDVGTFMGLSATLLSIRAEKVYTIDQFTKNKHLDFKNYNYKDVKKALLKFKNIKVIKGLTKDVVIDETFDVVFIDATHFQPQLSEDYVKFVRQLKSGGYILFHDCTETYPDIMALCEKIINQNFMKFVEKIGTINVFKKY